MKVKKNYDQDRCKYCYMDLGRSDIYSNGCGCGMKKCYFDCKTEKERREWEDEDAV